MQYIGSNNDKYTHLMARSGASISIWDRGTCPPIFIKGDVHGNVPPQYFRSDVV